MTVDENDNFYVMDDEEENIYDIDDSPRNFASYDDEEREELMEEEEQKSERKNVFGLLLKIMFNPVEGWKTLRRGKINIEKLQSGCFYPLLAILAISKFSEYIYSVNVNLKQVITDSVVSFVSFFFSYFCVPMALAWFLPKATKEKMDETYMKGYILVALSTLVLFSIVTNLLPMLWPILIFLPIWTLYLMFKGVRFFKFPQNLELRFYIVSGAAVIGMPLVIDWVLTTIMPY